MAADTFAMTATRYSSIANSSAGNMERRDAQCYCAIKHSFDTKCMRTEVTGGVGSALQQECIDAMVHSRATNRQLTDY